MFKTLECSRLRSTREITDVFNSQDETDLVFTEEKVNFLFSYFYRLHAMSHQLKKEVLKMQNRNFLANLNNFDTTIFVTF